jgi:hypothetical protein
MLVLTNPEFVAPQEDGLYLVLVDTDKVTGQFFFDDVDLGLYAFVALTDTDQQLSIREMDTGAASIVTVDAERLNTVIDLGMLRLP